MSRLLILAGALAVSSGCNTAIGNYFANRGRDLGECVRLEIGGGFGLGVNVEAAGVAHLGLTIASVPHVAGIGWRYGEGHAFGAGEWDPAWDTEVDLSGPVVTALFGLAWLTKDQPNDHRAEIDGPKPFALHFRSEDSLRPWGGAPGTRMMWTPLLPSLGAWISVPSEGDRPPMQHPRWIWDFDDPRAIKARVHAFDIEAHVFAGVVYARVGFSPGQFLDFLLGWFGADIAGDDHVLRKP